MNKLFTNLTDKQIADFYDSELLLDGIWDAQDFVDAVRRLEGFAVDPRISASQPVPREPGGDVRVDLLGE